MTNKVCNIETELEELYMLQVNWATVGFGSLTLECQDRVNNTWNMFREEFNELKIAAEDKVAILDSVADMFVVLCQIHHLYKPKNEDGNSHYVDTLDSISIREFIRRVDILLSCADVGEAHGARKELALLLPKYWLVLAKSLELKYGYPVIEGIVEVTNSNWSKFPSISELREIHDTEDNEHTATEVLEKECLAIAKVYPQFKDIVYRLLDTTPEEGLDSLTGDAEKHIRVAFRCDGGAGKIVKPSTYFSPDLEKLFDNNNKDSV